MDEERYEDRREEFVQFWSKRKVVTLDSKSNPYIMLVDQDLVFKRNCNIQRAF
jgi:hypothetical protein